MKIKKTNLFPVHQGKNEYCRGQQQRICKTYFQGNISQNNGNDNIVYPYSNNN
jgi:hypothetical protein